MSDIPVDETYYKNFADNEVVSIMQNLMKEALKQEVETLEALNNIELLVDTELVPTDGFIEDYRKAFVIYLKDRRNAYAKYLAKEANAKFDDAFKLVNNLFTSGDLQKSMSIEAIKAVLDANVLNVAFYDGSKKEEKPKVSEQSYATPDHLEALGEIYTLKQKYPNNRQAGDWNVSITLSDPTDNYNKYAFTMPSGNAYNISMHDGATADEAMRLLLEFEEFVVKAKAELGARFGKGYQPVKQQQYGDVERSYTPPANEKPAQPKGNTQQDAPVQGALTREVVAIEIVQAKTEKKTIGYKPFYMSDNNGKQERKQVASTGLWSSKANNALLKILHEQGIDLTPFKVGMVIPLDTPIICEYIQKPHFSNPEQKVNEVVTYRKVGS